MKVALELAAWLIAFVSGLVCLMAWSFVLTPGSGSHFGGLSAIGLLSGLFLVLFGTLGLILSRPRLGRVWKDVNR